MSVPLIITSGPDQKDTASALTGKNIDRITSVNKSSFSSGYEWYEPDEGYFGMIYPLRWHPLYGETRMSEILSNTIAYKNNLQEKGDSQALEHARDKVGYVVKESPFRRGLAGMLRWSIGLLICVIFMIVIYINFGKTKIYYFFGILSLISLGFIGYHAVDYTLYAKPESQRLWLNYTSYVDSSSGTGSNLDSILSNVRQVEQQNEIISAQKQIAQSQGQSSTGFNTGLGAGVGAGVGLEVGKGLASFLGNIASNYGNK
jgi:hypothetical protein